MLSLTLKIMRCELDADSLDLMVDDLLYLPDANIAQALSRCRRELPSGHKLALKDILDRAGYSQANPSEQAEADALIAFEKVQALVTERFVTRDVHGNYSLAAKTVMERDEHGEMKITVKDGVRAVASKTVPVPELGSRIERVIRLMGGIGVFAEMNEQNIPFVRRDFVSYYKSDPVVADRLALAAGGVPKELEAGVQLALSGKAMK